MTLEEEGEIENCFFQHITILGRDGHIIHFIYGNKNKVRPLKNCSFEKCEVECGKPVLCEYLTSKEIYSTQEITNFD